MPSKVLLQVMLLVCLCGVRGFALDAWGEALVFVESYGVLREKVDSLVSLAERKAGRTVVEQLRAGDDLQAAVAEALDVSAAMRSDAVKIRRACEEKNKAGPCEVYPLIESGCSLIDFMLLTLRRYGLAADARHLGLVKSARDISRIHQADLENFKRLWKSGKNPGLK